MTYDLLFRNTSCGDVAVKDEEIVCVGEAQEDAAQEIDATGLWLLPGGIDVHTHLGLTVGRNSTCDGWELGSKAALAGGTTTVIEHISFDAEGSCRAALELAFIQAGGRCCCDRLAGDRVGHAQNRSAHKADHGQAQSHISQI